MLKIPKKNQRSLKFPEWRWHEWLLRKTILNLKIQRQPSNDESSFTLDFFDSDELENRFERTA